MLPSFWFPAVRLCRIRRGKAGGAETPAEKTGPEKVQVKKTIYVPNVIRETSFYSDGFVESYKTFTYDEQMNVVREDFFDSFDQIIESVVYEGAEAPQ